MYTNLVLGPGGVKGFLIIGALKVLHKEGLLANIKRYIGVSVGSIISLLLVCGYNVDEILYEALNMPNLLSDFDAVSSFKGITKITKESIQNGGLVSNSKIQDKLEELVTRKYGMVPTMKQLYDITGDEYVSVTLNISKDKTEYLSYTNSPNLQCTSAALMSINIPVVFQKLKYNGDLYVDGAFGNPYPINMFPELSIGLYIESTFEDIDENVYSYLFKIITCSMTQMSNRNRLDRPDCFNIKLFTASKDTLGSALSQKDKMDMYHQGYMIADALVSGGNESADKTSVFSGDKKTSSEKTSVLGGDKLRRSSSPLLDS